MITTTAKKDWTYLDFIAELYREKPECSYLDWIGNVYADHLAKAALMSVETELKKTHGFMRRRR